MSEETAFAEEFSWYPLLFTAANEQYLKISEVTKTPALEFLYFINFYKRKCELDAERIKKSTKTN